MLDSDLLVKKVATYQECGRVTAPTYLFSTKMPATGLCNSLLLSESMLSFVYLAMNRT